MREVSDSLHLRRFCLVPIDEEVQHESTVRKLTRRLGAEVAAELSRLVIAKAQRQTRFRARAVRIDSTVVEADVRCPTDAGLAGDGVRTLAREGRRLRAKLGPTTTTLRDRSRALGKRLRAIARTLRRRTGEAKAEVLALTGQTGRLLAASTREARRLAAKARAKARPLARSRQAKASTEELAPLAPKRTFIAGRASPGSRRTQRRLARYRVGAEGRISHLKRRHGLRRSRLKGGEGERTWTGWAVFAYNVETYGRYA